MATTKPPYYWKVPSIEKDYMSENVQRIRRTAAQNRNREPMKAAFIPGVTKNAKYAHVTSRVGEILKQPNLGAGGEDGSLAGAMRSKSSMSIASNKSSQPQRSGPRGSIIPEQRGMPVSRRLSRSSTDLATDNKTGYSSTATTSAPAGQQRGQMTAEGPGNYVPRARRKPRGLQAEDESVYNWRFSDNSTPSNMHPSHPHNNGNCGGGNQKIKTFHRVEYLPCDGICADETLEERYNDGSGRSSSRTSRGMNTEETRIIQESLQELDLGSSPRSQSMDNIGAALGNSKGNMTGYNNQSWEPPVPNGLQEQIIPNGNKVGFILDSGRKQQAAAGKSTAATRSNSTANRIIPSANNEFFHTPGVVPKYIKQRQDELKVEAERVAKSTPDPDVPPGHVLLSEKERVDTLQELKSKYSTLIDELNRVPIRIDTMRVREHKIQLEQQLQKLERGIAIFSRARVFVKMPEHGSIGEMQSRLAI